jgi:hypothetical protein
MKRIHNEKKLRFLKIDPNGIPLAEVMAVHKQFSTGLQQNLGDGFLLHWNPIYRNIREAYLARGFSFTEENIADYFSFPLMALDEVLVKKKIPYRPNFLWLEKLQKVAPNRFTLTEIKRSELQLNYLFHESAHFIAHSVFFGKKPMQRLPKNSDSILKILIGESFANTAEAMSAALVQGEIGSFFLDANCHFRSNEKEVAIILKFAKREGFPATAKVLLGAFLYANYMNEEFSEAKLNRIAKFSRVKKGSSIKGLAKIGLQLSEQFRVTTTQFHLAKLGFPFDLQPLMNADPVDRLIKNAKLHAQVLQLTDILCKDLENKVEFLD